MLPPPPGMLPRPSIAEMTEIAGVSTPSPMIMPTPSTHSVLITICRKRPCIQGFALLQIAVIVTMKLLHETVGHKCMPTLDSFIRAGEELTLQEVHLQQC